MFDLEAMQRQLDKSVREAVKSEISKISGLQFTSELVASLLAKPFLSFPDDIGVVLGTGRSTTFNLVRDDASFPPRATVGRKAFVDTAAFVTWLQSKTTA